MSKLIPAADALIGALNEGGRITAVVVLSAADGGKADPRWRACNLTFGACCADWMRDPYSHPEFVFSELAVAWGFVDAMAMERAIAEFGRIKECGWARKMMPTKRQAKAAWRVA